LYLVKEDAIQPADVLLVRKRLVWRREGEERKERERRDKTGCRAREKWERRGREGEDVEDWKERRGEAEGEKGGRGSGGMDKEGRGCRGAEGRGEGRKKRRGKGEGQEINQRTQATPVTTPMALYRILSECGVSTASYPELPSSENLGNFFFFCYRLQNFRANSGGPIFFRIFWFFP
jgi:hypothetical protein